MTTLVIVSIGLSLTQLVTLGWLARRTTRANRNIDILTDRCAGNIVALECHERRIDLLFVNHNHHRERLDSTWANLQTLDNTVHAREQAQRDLQRQIEYLVERYNDLDHDVEDVIAETCQHEAITERRFEGINGDIDTLFDDVLIQKGGGL